MKRLLLSFLLIIPISMSADQCTTVCNTFGSGSTQCRACHSVISSPAPTSTIEGQETEKSRTQKWVGQATPAPTSTTTAKHTVQTWVVQLTQQSTELQETLGSMKKAVSEKSSTQETPSTQTSTK